jgi:hypothetical protein
MDTWIVSRKPIGVYKPLQGPEVRVNRLSFAMHQLIRLEINLLFQGAYHGWSM